MKNKELFNRTVAVLVKAYQNNTLKHGTCYACAVGNLVTASKGIKYQSNLVWDNGKYPCWTFVHVFHKGIESQLFNRGTNKEIHKGIVEIESTGYKYHETAKIELAFETANKGKSEEDYVFNGLMSVIDCLMGIHEANTEEVKEAKLLFVKP